GVRAAHIAVHSSRCRLAGTRRKNRNRFSEMHRIGSSISAPVAQVDRRGLSRTGLIACEETRRYRADGHSKGIRGLALIRHGDLRGRSRDSVWDNGPYLRRGRIQDGCDDTVERDGSAAKFLAEQSSVRLILRQLQWPETEPVNRHDFPRAERVRSLT